MTRMFIDNRARVAAAMSVIAATYLLFSTPSVRGAELIGAPAPAGLAVAIH